MAKNLIISGIVEHPICGKATFSGKEGKTSVKSKSDTDFFLNLSPKEIKHTVVEMPVGIGMSSYLEKLWKEGKL